jgi:DNA polymerase I-like protein with 3'-5' exonuclease and polymerase domains
MYRQVERNGYVLTGLYGVRVAVKRDFAYNGLNYQIQATEAEMMKNTLVKLDAFLKDRQSKIALPFHDEIILHLHNDEENLIPAIKAIVEDHKLRVPMLSEVKIARTSWAEKMNYVLPATNERNGETDCRAGAMPLQTDKKGGV